MSYIYDLTDTWNAGGTTFNGIKLNVTDSASAVSSKLVTLQTNGTEHFSVTKAGVGYVSGNLGVGTSSPTVKLDVNGDAAFGSTIITGSGASTGDVRLELGGNRSSAGNAFIDFHALAGQDYNGRVLRTSGANGSFEITNAGTGAMTFSTNNGERMRINGSNGNVGIGTSNPNYKLEANGIIASYLSGQAGYWTYNGGATAEWFTGQRSGTDHAYKISQVAAGIYTDRVTVDTSGSVGVGVVPSAWSAIRPVQTGLAASFSGGSAFNDAFIASNAYYDGSNWRYINSNTAYYQSVGGAAAARWYTAASGTAGNTISFSEAMRIDSSGNVGIGTSSPGAKLDVNGNVYVRTGGFIATDAIGEYSGGAVNLTIGPTGDRSLILRTNNTEKARISASGFLQVGTTTEFPGLGNTVGGISFEPSGSAFFSRNGANIALFVNRGGDGTVVSIRSSGTEVGSISFSGSTTSYNTSSDYRLKDIDGPIVNSGSYIDALNPVQGSWKEDGRRFIGLLAHEVQEVSETSIATGEKDGEEMQAMDYSAPELITNLIAEIQSLRTRVAQLEGK